MSFFINSGVFTNEVCKIARSKKVNESFVLTVPNYVSTDNSHEDIKFIFDKYTGNNLIKRKRNYTFKSPAILNQTDSNTYLVEFFYGELIKSTSMYALLRSNTAFPDDIFILSDMKDKINVLRKISFKDSEPDLAGFSSSVYLVEICLSHNESIPICFTSINQANTGKYMIISNSEGTYKISDEIKKNPSSKEKFISLSECIGFENKDVSNFLSDKQKTFLIAMYLSGVKTFEYNRYRFILFDRFNRFIKMLYFNKGNDEFNLRILDRYLNEQHTYNIEDLIKSFCPEYAHLIKNS